MFVRLDESNFEKSIEVILPASGIIYLKKLSKLFALDEKSISTLVPEGTFVPADIAIPSILKVK